MTEKEMLYLEDAVGHEKNIIKICDETIKMMDDDNLINFMQNQKELHMQTKEKLMNIMEEKYNE